MELHDSYVQLFCEFLESTACDGLMSGHDIFRQLQTMPHVESIRKDMKKIGKNQRSLLGNSMAQSPYWSKVIDQYAVLTSACKVHKHRLEAVVSWFTALVDSKDLGCAVTMMRDLGFLSAELKEGFAGTMKQCQGQMKKVLSAAVKGVQERSWEGDKRELQSVLMEATLVWPEEQEFGTMSEALSSELAAVSGEEKWNKVVAALKSLQDAVCIASTEASDVEKALDNAAREASESQGLPWPSDAKFDVQSLMTDLASYFLDEMEQPDSMAAKVLEAMETFKAWSPEKGTSLVNGLNILLALRNAWMEYKADQDEVSAMLKEHQDDLEPLSQLMRCCEEARRSRQQWPAQAVEKLQQLLQVADKLVQGMSPVWVGGGHGGRLVLRCPHGGGCAK